MLDVEGRDHVDPGVEQLLDVLPPLLVPRTRHVRVGELVDERDLRAAGDDGVDVHLLEPRRGTSITRRGIDLEAVDLLGGVRPAVRLDEPDDDIGAPLTPPTALVEHREGLPDTRRGPEVHAQPTSRPCRPAYEGTGVERDGELGTTRRSPRNPSARPSM